MTDININDMFVINGMNEYEERFLKRLTFEDYMRVMEYIVNQIEVKIEWVNYIVKIIVVILRKKDMIFVKIV